MHGVYTLNGVYFNLHNFEKINRKTFPSLMLINWMISTTSNPPCQSTRCQANVINTEQTSSMKAHINQSLLHTVKLLTSEGMKEHFPLLSASSVSHSLPVSLLYLSSPLPPSWQLFAGYKHSGSETQWMVCHPIRHPASLQKPCKMESWPQIPNAYVIKNVSLLATGLDQVPNSYIEVIQSDWSIPHL